MRRRGDRRELSHPGKTDLGMGHCVDIDPLRGQVIGEKYRIEQLLGEGGVGKVYRAHRLDDGADVALKIINTARVAGVKPRILLTRARREASALASLSSPHLVELHDFITIDNESVAIIMDLADGPTLDYLLEEVEVGLCLRRAVDITAQIASVMAQVHHKGLIHRDLKPSNIVVESNKGADFIKLLDFGILHDPSQPRITQGFLGTPVYSSPEQLFGHPIDPRTDIYALGAMLYHMIAGQPPFGSGSILSLVRAHASDPPPPLEQFAELRATVPSALVELVHRMLEKSPEGRPDTMTAVAGELGLILQSLTQATCDDEFSAPGHSLAEETRTSSPYLTTPCSVSSTAVAVACRDERLSDGHRTSQLTSSWKAFHAHYDEPRRTIQMYSAEDPRGWPVWTSPRPLRVLTLDHQALLLGFEGGDAALLDTESNEFTPIFESRDVAITAASLDMDSSTVFIGLQDGDVWMLEGFDDTSAWRRVRSGAPVVTLRYHGRSRSLLVSDAQGISSMYHLRSEHKSSCRKVWRRRFDTKVRTEAFSDDGYLLGLVMSDSQVKICSAIDGSVVDSFPASNSAAAISFNGSGQVVLTELASLLG